MRGNRNRYNLPFLIIFEGSNLVLISRCLFSSLSLSLSLSCFSILRSFSPFVFISHFLSFFYFPLLFFLFSLYFYLSLSCFLLLLIFPFCQFLSNPLWLDWSRIKSPCESENWFSSSYLSISNKFSLHLCCLHLWSGPQGCCLMF